MSCSDYCVSCRRGADTDSSVGSELVTTTYSKEQRRRRLTIRRFRNRVVRAWRVVTGVRDYEMIRLISENKQLCIQLYQIGQIVDRTEDLNTQRLRIRDLSKTNKERDSETTLDVEHYVTSRMLEYGTIEEAAKPTDVR